MADAITSSVSFSVKTSMSDEPPGHRSPPQELAHAFDPEEVKSWDPDRFFFVKKLQDATRNQGTVILMRDLLEPRFVAVKVMPNHWVGSSHENFLRMHPWETELPWQDVGTAKYLASIGWKYSMELLGVFRDKHHTEVVSEYATHGDLFKWCSDVDQDLGSSREEAVWPMVVQVLQGLRELHEMSISHRDISLENVLVTDEEGQVPKIIDFGMASTSRFVHTTTGKKAYQAPELHGDEPVDSFLADAFSMGVTIFAIYMKDYPWTNTLDCKCFLYAKEHGIRGLLSKRKVKNSSQRFIEVMSEPFVTLLEGLLCFEPSGRLTLGEAAFHDERPSVWEQVWVRYGPSVW